MAQGFVNMVFPSGSQILRPHTWFDSETTLASAFTYHLSSMQKIQVDGDGTELAYIDSGAPPGESYTTLVCVHGHSYHAQNFSRLFPLAQKRNLRIIALNRRDYVGSTPFSQEELETLSTGSEYAQGQFLRARGLEIARFLVWVITKLNIPCASGDGTTGGLALLGWSLGNVTTMAFLANLRTYPDNIVQTVESYLRTIFMYELPDHSLGYPPPEGSFHPLENTSIPERVRGIAFGKWVSSYYAHPAYASESESESESKAHTDSVFPSGSRSIDALQLHAPKKAARLCTLDRLTPRELLACVDAAPGGRSEKLLWRLPMSLLHSQKCEALLLRTEPSGETVVSELPVLKVRVICGLASLWVVQWETWALEEECSKWALEGQNVRPIRFIPVEDANHFLHWDDADTFLRLCSNGIRS